MIEGDGYESGVASASAPIEGAAVESPAMDALWRTEERLVRALIADIQKLRADASDADAAYEPLAAVPERETEAALAFEPEPMGQTEVMTEPVPDETCEVEAALAFEPEPLPEAEPESAPAFESEPWPQADAWHAPAHMEAHELEPEPESGHEAAGDPFQLDASSEEAADLPEPDDGEVADTRGLEGDMFATSEDSGPMAVATLVAVDDETGDCFTYEIVDRDGMPAEHPYFELVGHEIRLKAGANPEQGCSGYDVIRLKVANAAGDERIVEYAIASAEIEDQGRVEPQHESPHGARRTACA